MKNKRASLAVLALSLAVAAPAFAADVGVSVSISQPGVYGRVDVGRFPQPALVMAQPVIVQRPVGYYHPEPVYMWVPPAHRVNWRRHCGAYGACGVPVYFVQDRWYDNHVRHPAPRGYHDRHDRHDHRGGPGRGHGPDRHPGRGHDGRHDHRDEHRGPDRGHGKH
jgi:hypothetical protein